ncbi:Hint domain-containing protein [Marivita sp. XM-24bin2]|jgi:hypothetical protein|uniref:Hint domain-containing protein n=1 Tax=unclassified Marivita TaxID=2632480 RepID=UPI000D79907C|nr:MAG: hypothetical protein DCO97_16385 [Marivita sp. XM-24bin2]
MRYCRSVRYIHVSLDRHAILNADGLAAESFLTGPIARRNLSNEQRAVIRPYLLSATAGASKGGYRFARPLKTVWQAKQYLRGGAPIAAISERSNAAVVLPAVCAQYGQAKRRSGGTLRGSAPISATLLCRISLGFRSPLEERVVEYRCSHER